MYIIMYRVIYYLVHKLLDTVDYSKTNQDHIAKQSQKRDRHAIQGVVERLVKRSRRKTVIRQTPSEVLGWKVLQMPS